MWWRQRAPSSPPKTLLALLQLAGQVGLQRANLYCDSLSLVASDTAELAIVDEAQATRLDVPEGMSVSSTLGVFGGTGLTAYFGLTRVRPAFATRCASFSQAHALLRSALCAMARAFSSPRPPERPDRWSRRSRSACTPFARRGFGSAQDTPSTVLALRRYGCRVVGIAGGAEKCRWLETVVGVDATVDYKSCSSRRELRARLKQVSGLAQDGTS